MISPFFGLVAQLVEQRIENPRVGGSIPPQATTELPIVAQQCPEARMNIGSAGFYFAQRCPRLPRDYQIF